MIRGSPAVVILPNELEERLVFGPRPTPVEGVGPPKFGWLVTLKLSTRASIWSRSVTLNLRLIAASTSKAGGVRRMKCPALPKVPGEFCQNPVGLAPR